MTPDERSSLRACLLHEQIAGDTLTPRLSAVQNAELLAEGDPDKQLGFRFEDLTAQETIDAVADLCGCSNDLSERDGPGVIDPDRTIDALIAVAGRLAEAARAGEHLLIATGHPTGLLSSYMAVARALVAAGCKIRMPLSNVRLAPPPDAPPAIAGRRRGNKIRYLDGVACFTDGAALYHTHEAWPVERLLDACEPPDLVLSDHGFAGAAIVRGLETLAFADVNDPALAVARSRGLTKIVVPLDDNREPERYAEMTRFLVQAIENR